MKTALLAQNEALESRELNPQAYKRSVIPLSHSVTYPVDVEGAITPICCVECVPSDSFKISNEILLRQLQPLKVPVMTKYTLNTAYFFCSNRLAWKKWAMFADQANKGRSGVSYSFELPRLVNHQAAYGTSEDYELLQSLVDVSPQDITGTYYTNGKNINYVNSLHTYFDISMNYQLSSNTLKENYPNEDNELPLAFPDFDYQIICRDFYTNIDRLPDNPEIDGSKFFDFSDPFSDWAFSNLYPIDDDEIRLNDGPQIQSGFHTGDDSDSTKRVGFVLDKIRYHDLRMDYFKSSLRAPMRGEAPSIDTTISVSSVDFSEAISSVTGDTTNLLAVSEKGITEVQGLKQSNLYHDGLNPDWSTASTSTNSSIVSANGYASASQQNLINSLNKLKVTLSTAKKINQADLILLNQLTLWQTLNMLHKPYYNDFLNAHYTGVKVGDSLAEKPQYIGGTSQVIDINEVLQTSQSTDSSKLGSQAAVAHSLSGSYVGSYYCQDYGFIIGVMYIIPDIVYDPAMPRWASRRSIEDYFFPEFANLSMQATLNKELFFSNDDEWNNQPLGYVGAYDELRSIPNYCAGDLLNSAYSDLKPWVLRQSMSNENKPAINQRFNSAKGNVDMTAWTVPNAPKFMMQCANYIEAVRPMPYIAIPSLT